jgi:hypothetical protein
MENDEDGHLGYPHGTNEPLKYKADVVVMVLQLDPRVYIYHEVRPLGEAAQVQYRCNGEGDGDGGGGGEQMARPPPTTFVSCLSKSLSLWAASIKTGFSVGAGPSGGRS